jgi:hypothetical protein
MSQNKTIIAWTKYEIENLGGTVRLPITSTGADIQKIGRAKS